jgi:outer membrane protein assembly factor BamB
MSRRHVLAGVLVALASSSSLRAQIPFPKDLLPTRTALARLGLEQQWMSVVPLFGDERLQAISMAEDLLFAQTNKGYFHAFNAESGQLIWTARLGTQSIEAQGASLNSFAVFVTSMDSLYALDRATGHPLWVAKLLAQPSSSTAADEDRAMVGLVNGKIYAYDLKMKDPKSGKIKLADKPIEAWNWQTGAAVRTRPLPAGRIVVFGSDDGKVYVGLADERKMLFRIATGGAIGTGFGTIGTRLLLVPSADTVFYGVDVLSSKVLWTFPTGTPIGQEPMVGDQDVFVVNSVGLLSSIDPNNGSVHWTTSTKGGRLLAIGSKRIYLESHDDDLFIIDRATGQMIADPKSTRDRVGLNLRPYELGITNRLNDRLYFGTTSGMVISLRELGQTKPRLLRDPKALPFGYIPPEGISLAPTGPTIAPEAVPPAEGADAPAPGDAPK